MWGSIGECCIGSLCEAVCRASVYINDYPPVLSRVK